MATRINIEETVKALMAAKTNDEFCDLADKADNFDLPVLAKAYVAAKLGQAAADAFKPGRSPTSTLDAMLKAHLAKR